MAAQITAVVIFIAMFVMIVWDKIERQIVTLACGGLTLVLVFGVCMKDIVAAVNTLNFHSIVSSQFWYEAGKASESSAGINWATIFFIAGMMVMVEGMAEAGFFRWLCLRIAKLVDFKPVRILITFMIMSFVLAMFIDSITVILFLAAVTIELARILKFDPVPLIIAEVFCANLGGSATMCGDPPNIIIGTSLGYSFMDFLINTGVLAMISLVFVILYFWKIYHKKLVAGENAEKEAALLNPADAITNRKDFVVSSIIFGCAVVLLVTHAQTGLTVATIGIGIAIITLIAAGKKAVTLIKRIDYKTLLFFIGLFIVVGGLEQTGILEVIAHGIEKISGGNTKVMVSIIIWISAVASAFVDNIPFAATMIPVIKSISATMGVDLSVLSWGLAMGTDIGGSATPIGASANVVGIATAAKEGHSIGWKKYCLASVPATMIVFFCVNLMSRIILPQHDQYTCQKNHDQK